MAFHHIYEDYKEKELVRIPFPSNLENSFKQIEKSFQLLSDKFSQHQESYKILYSKIKILEEKVKENADYSIDILLQIKDIKEYLELVEFNSDKTAYAVCMISSIMANGDHSKIAEQCHDPH